MVKKVTRELIPGSVYTRIRPISDGGTDGHGVGEEVDKHLAGFEDGAMLIGTKGSADVERFDFPKQVMGPETTQDGVFETAAPELLDGFLAGDNSALLFAYGQTGTGKTHTMFGPAESLSSPAAHPDWGLLPRIVQATLAHCGSGTVTGQLHLSAIEFYAMFPFDLNAAKRNPVTVTSDGEVFGHTFTPVSSPSDIAPFIERVYGNRKVNKTKMNSGSSRSHVCIILTLYQVDNETQQFSETKFSIIDLAGSERPDKTGAGRVDTLTAFLEAKKSFETGKPLSAGAQGALINTELTEITSAISKATDCWQMGRKFKPHTDWPPSMKYMLGCCTGSARLGVIVAISQSPQNGWETWFSCTWGQMVAKLRAPCDKQKAKKLTSEIKTAAKEKKSAADSLAKAGSSASFQKYALKRQGLASFTTERLKHLEGLAAALDAAGADDGDAAEESSSNSALLDEILCIDLMSAFAVFDKNGDGIIDKDELVSILSHGNGLHVFNPDMAARVAEDVIKYYASEDGKLRAEGCCEFFKQEKMFQAMTREEKEAWYQENPDFDYTKKVVLGSPEPAQE